MQPRAMLMTGSMLGIAFLFSGCASNHASLTLLSQPEGAYITEMRTGKAYGLAPVRLSYDKEGLQKSRGKDGCYYLQGFTARWMSGAAKQANPLKICGSPTGNYHYTFSRDPSAPGFDKDMQFALQLQSVQAQKKQAKAANDAANAAFLSAVTNSMPKSVSCTSTPFGTGMISTNCR